METMRNHTMREINEALDWISPEPDAPGWESVMILTDAINELELLRAIAHAADKRPEVQEGAAARQSEIDEV